MVKLLLEYGGPRLVHPEHISKILFDMGQITAHVCHDGIFCEVIEGIIAIVPAEEVVVAEASIIPVEQLIMDPLAVPAALS